MEINERTYDQLDRYLSGKMGTGEKLAFEKLLSENPVLKAELEWMQSAVEGIRSTGKAELLQELKSIGASIPAGEFEKYDPSVLSPKGGWINKGFWAKWWWAIAAAVVATAAAITWFVVHEQKTNSGSESDVIGSDVMPPAPGKDSAINLLSTDSAKKEISLSPTRDCHTYSVDVITNYGVIFYDADTNDYSEMSLGRHRKIQKLDVTFCPQLQETAIYTFGKGVTITGELRDTTGLRFYGHGDTLWISDGNPNWFLLTRGGGEKLLKRVLKETGQKKSKTAMIQSVKDTAKTLTRAGNTYRTEAGGK